MNEGDRIERLEQRLAVLEGLVRELAGPRGRGEVGQRDSGAAGGVSGAAGQRGSRAATAA